MLDSWDTMTRPTESKAYSDIGIQNDFVGGIGKLLLVLIPLTIIHHQSVWLKFVVL